jgi:sec-independent protein translocase protein TatA
MGLGTGEIILIVLVILLVFGAAKLPQIGDGMGRAIGSFKRALGGIFEREGSWQKEQHDRGAPPANQGAAKPTDKPS